MAGTMDTKLDILISVQRETLDAIKRLADAQELRLDHIEAELKELWQEIEKGSASRKEIYERIEKIMRTCAGRHGLIDERLRDPSISGDGKGTLKDIAYSAWGIIGAAILGGAGTELLRAILRR